MHRKAIGWDMLKAPANIALAVPQLAAKLAASGAKAVGADRVSEYLGSRKLVFDTEVGNEIEWLVITELLELPFRQGERVSHRDALAEAILSAPELQERMQQALGTTGGRGTMLPSANVSRKPWRPMPERESQPRRSQPP
jgi:hypothetical protein